MASRRALVFGLLVLAFCLQSTMVQGFVALTSLTNATSPPPFVIFGNALKIPTDPINPPYDPDTDDLVVIDLMNPFTAAGVVRSWSAAGNVTNGDGGVVTFIIFRETNTTGEYNVTCTNTFTWSTGQAISGRNPLYFKQFFVPLNHQCFAEAGDILGLRVHGTGSVRIFKENTKLQTYQMGWRRNVDLDLVSIVDFSGTTDGSIGQRASIVVYSWNAAFYVGATRSFECGGLQNPDACNITNGDCVPPGVCECILAYDGPYCGDDRDGCLSPTTACFPGASCIDVPAPGTGNICGPCPPGYEGDGITCTDVNGCSGGSNPCFGNSTCVDVTAPGTGATCTDCDPGYSGIYCDEDFNACDSNPCFPGVTCTDLAPPSNGYTCGSCPAGYEGDGQVCTDYDGCSPNPCYAGVSCADLPPPSTGHVCGACPPSAPLGDGENCYSSYVCFGEHLPGTVCSGHGTCVGPDECECDIGYNGTQCENFAGYFCPFAPNVTDVHFCANNCISRLPCFYCCKWQLYQIPGNHMACRRNCQLQFPWWFWEAPPPDMP